MNTSEMDRLCKAAFSPMTIFKAYRQDQLKQAIKDNPVAFVQFMTRSKIRPQLQMEIMSFFLDDAFTKSGLKPEYKTHLRLFLDDLSYTWLWPSSVSTTKYITRKARHFSPRQIVLFINGTIFY